MCRTTPLNPLNPLNLVEPALEFARNQGKARPTGEP